mmetsp:Transcript_11428/g.46084  ORF Transcript_11428/g.46084 Transcript_11428/m.46084 type:complete len:441 (-) Transcript_11428:74-1396(-)
MRRLVVPPVPRRKLLREHGDDVYARVSRLDVAHEIEGVRDDESGAVAGEDVVAGRRRTIEEVGVGVGGRGRGARAGVRHQRAGGVGRSEIRGRLPRTMRHRPSFLVARYAWYSATFSSYTSHTQNLHCGELWQQSSAPGAGGSVGGLSTHRQNRRWHVSQIGAGGGRSSCLPTRSRPASGVGPPAPVQTLRPSRASDPSPPAVRAGHIHAARVSRLPPTPLSRPCCGGAGGACSASAGCAALVSGMRGARPCPSRGLDREFVRRAPRRVTNVGAAHGASEPLGSSDRFSQPFRLLQDGASECYSTTQQRVPQSMVRQRAAHRATLLLARSGAPVQRLHRDYQRNDPYTYRALSGTSQVGLGFISILEEDTEIVYGRPGAEEDIPLGGWNHVHAGAPYRRDHIRIHLYMGHRGADGISVEDVRPCSQEVPRCKTLRFNCPL